jgi:ubiquinone/menaquinone biosynthesis C-methylase UbiE
MNMSVDELRKRWFAWGIAQVMKVYEPLIRERKQKLLGGLEGHILEIGPGTGPNLKYLTPGTKWTGLEYNPHMFPYLAREAERCGLDFDLIQGSAQAIPLPDASVDVVLGTLVLCSVPDPQGVLAEVQRVLKPGGRYVFIEHVAGSPGSRIERIQQVMKPIWCCCADGCHPDRRSGETIRHSGFRELDLETFELRFPIVAPHVMGIARV